MTLQEAIKSGKPFRRKAQVSELYFVRAEMDGDRIFVYYPSGSGWSVDLTDIMAEDWEIQTMPREYYGYVVGDRLVSVTPDLDELLCLRNGDKTKIIKVREVIE